MIRLYHGTNTLFDAPDLAVCQPYKDFGRGFYLTPDLAVARRMAERSVARSLWQGGPQYVLTYLFDETRISELNIRRFDNPINEEFARFVMANRLFRTRAADHNRDNRFDIVIGPIADDRMGVLFRRFEAGLVTVENLIEELKFKKVAMQYSFHTAKGLGLLAFKEAKRV